MENTTTITPIPSIGKLATALSLAQAVMKAAPKNKINPFFKAKYADLDCIWDTCREPLTKNGLSIIQLATATGPIVTISTILLHSSGESLRSDLSMKARDETPQSIGSTITYGRRYGLSTMVGISSEDDDDANSAQPNGKPTVEMPKEKPAPTGAPTSKAKNPISEKQVGRLHAIAKSSGYSDEDIHIFLAEEYGIGSSKDIEREFYEDVVLNFQTPKVKDE